MSLPVQTPAEINARLAWEVCEKTARAWKMDGIWQASQQWPNFRTAWDAWLVAFEQRLSNYQPQLKGKLADGIPLREFREALFLAGLRVGKGDQPAWFQDNAWILFLAALDGNVEFFKRFAEAKRHKPDPRQLQYHILTCWMVAGLWSATDVACADFILKHFNFRHGTTGSVRQAWMKLNLWHSRLPIIKRWLWAEKGKKLKNPKPIFYPTRLPKV